VTGQVGAVPGAGAGPGEPHDDPDVLARVAWSALTEPGDPVAGAVVAALGAPEALEWAVWAVTATPAAAARGLRVAVRRLGGDPPAGPPAAGGTGAGATDDTTVSTRVLGRVLPRWAPRFADLEPRRTLDALDAVDGAVLTPGRPGWPRRLDDLGHTAPMLLWVRGEHDLGGLLDRSVAVVGARAATAYGQHVAGELGRGLASAGVTVVSGGAYGIDAAAHRGALLAEGATVAFLAGGVDRPSPAGNLDVLDRMRTEGGALVAESPLGTPPTRSRFLLRNRLIAAVTGATVVVEAAWRSGALSTAARATDLLRPVGAVPGPVTSMASVGCHRLLRDGGAVCVTDASEVVELLGAAGPPGDAADREVVLGVGSRAVGPTAGDARTVDRRVGDARAGDARAAAPPVPDPTDRADSAESRVLDALHRRHVRAVLDVARRAGLGEREVSATLGLLELAGAVEHALGGWRRCAAG
jgi:DNA processing protein